MKKAILIIALIVNTIAFSQVEKIDAIAAKYLKEENLSGSILVSKNNEIFFNKAYGFANYEFEVPNQTNTKHNLGSLGKQFTAAAILKLVENGLIKLEDKLSKYITEAPESWNEMTIHHVLSHTSGMTRWIYKDVKDMRSVKKPISLKENFEILMKMPLDYKTGTKWAYSNEGYRVLGEVIRRVSGKSFEDFMKDEIYLPLEMFDTDESYVGIQIFEEYGDGDYVSKTFKRMSKAYFIQKDGSWLNELDYQFIGSHGGGGMTHSTSEDFHKWFTAVINNQVLSPEMTKKLFAKHAETGEKTSDGNPVYYGYAWETAEVGDDRLIFHGGSTAGGHNAMFIYSTKKKVSVTVFTNVEVLKDDYNYFGKLAKEILSVM